MLISKINLPNCENFYRIVWVFPELLICSDCGAAEFTVAEAELRLFVKGDAAAAG